MERSMKRVMLALTLFSAPVLGDEIYLKGGGQLSGEIVEQTAETITIDIGAGTFGVKASTVVRIEKTTSPYQVYRVRAGNLSSTDAEGWRELARWAQGEALATQARDAWKQVVEILPGDQEANRALGRVELDGRWVSEEESYIARGFVEFEGEWMTPDERQAILTVRQQETAAQAAALDAQILAQQQAAAERAAAEQAEHDAYWQGVPMYGDPLYWGGWASGPVYWPSVPARSPNRPAQLPARGGRR
jgi:hypothetical protein